MAKNLAFGPLPALCLWSHDWEIPRSHTDPNFCLVAKPQKMVAKPQKIAGNALSASHSRCPL